MNAIELTAIISATAKVIFDDLRESEKKTRSESRGGWYADLQGMADMGHLNEKVVQAVLASKSRLTPIPNDERDNEVDPEHLLVIECECERCGAPLGLGLRVVTPREFREHKGKEYMRLTNITEEEAREFHGIDANKIVSVKMEYGVCNACRNFDE